MEYKFNKEAFKEQREFIKSLLRELKYTKVEYLYSFIHTFGPDVFRANFRKAIDEGRLSKWIEEEMRSCRIKSIDDITLKYFFESYVINDSHKTNDKIPNVNKMLKEELELSMYSFREQLAFLKCMRFYMVERGFEVDAYKEKFDAQEYANKLLINAINHGELQNWVANELNHKHVDDVSELYDIEYFMKSYNMNCLIHTKEKALSDSSVQIDNGTGFEQPFYTADELAKLDSVGCKFTTYTPCDFHESHDDNDDGTSIFSYDDSKMFVEHIEFPPEYWQQLNKFKNESLKYAKPHK